MSKISKNESKKTTRKHKDNELEYNLPKWLKPNLLLRGMKRLPDTIQIDLNLYEVTGNPNLSDTYPVYSVEYSPIDRHWNCSCQLHPGGDYRGQCSHIAACIAKKSQPAWRVLDQGELARLIDSADKWGRIPGFRLDNNLRDMLRKDIVGRVENGAAMLHIGVDPENGICPFPHPENYLQNPQNPAQEPSQESAQELAQPLGVEVAPAPYIDPIQREENRLASLVARLALLFGGAVTGATSGAVEKENLEPTANPSHPSNPPSLSYKENIINLAHQHLPSWCNLLRQNQIDALIQIQRAIDSGKRNIIFEGPTGMGKTLTAYLSAKINNARANYICTTKSLQEQAKKDFLDSELLMGRVNYPTATYAREFPEVSCRDCTFKSQFGCSKCEPDCDRDGRVLGWTSKLKCPYYIQKKKTQQANLAILNTAYAITVFSNKFASGVDNVKDKLGYCAPYVDQFADEETQAKQKQNTYGFALRGMSIYDEADELESTIMSFIEVEISPFVCNLFRISTPHKSSKWPARLEWIDKLIQKITDYEKRVNEDLFSQAAKEEPKSPEQAEVESDPEFGDKTMQRLLELKDKLQFVKESIDPMNSDERRETWVYERIDEDKCKFKPVRIDKFANKSLFVHSHINFIMSATVIAPEQFAQDLGLKQEETAFISMPSPFDPIRRPFIYKGVGNMSFKTKSTAIPKISSEIARIRREYQGRMLVHTVSYELNSALYSDLTRHGFDVFTYSNSGDRAGAIEQYKATENAILLAVSLARGIDFKHELCRLNVIAKVPFPNLGDLQISRRMYQPTPREGELWYKLKTIRDIVQMYGRGMRAEDDWCRTFILDEQFIRLWREVKSLLPNWFTDSVQFDSVDRLAGTE